MEFGIAILSVLGFDLLVSPLTTIATAVTRTRTNASMAPTEMTSSKQEAATTQSLAG